MNNETGSISSESYSDVATMLAKFSGLIGVPVPIHRFAFLSEVEGVSIETLALRSRIDLLWSTRFPAGRVQTVSHAEVDAADFPLLILFEEGTQQIGLVRGQKAGGLLVEFPGETAQVIKIIDLETYELLKLETGYDSETNRDNKSAKDWFWFAIGKHRRVFAEAIFATLMLSLFGLMSALYTMQVYDRVVPTNGFSTLWVLTVGVLIAILLEWAMKMVRAHMVNKTGKVIDIELSQVFFGKTLSIRADARPKTVGTFAAQIRQFEQVRNFYTTATLFVLADAPFALFFVGVIALIGGKVALVPLIMLPIALGIGFLTQAPIERLTKVNIEESNKKNGLLIEAIDGIESVKAVASEWKLKKRWRDLTLVISESDLKTQLLTNLATASTQSIQQLSYVGIIAVGAYEISQGNLTIGGLIACSIISGRALTPLAQVPSQIVQWKHAKIAVQALDGIMGMPDDRNFEQKLLVPESIDHRLAMNQLAFSYSPEVPLLAIEEVVFKPGERVAVLGAVGAGKSTFLKLLAGVYSPVSGEVLLGDIDLRQLAVETVREKIGWLPQDVRLFNGTLRENLLLGLPMLADEDLIRAAQLTGLGAVLQQNPRGFEIEISEGGKGLSGGQRQLVGLTRLLLARPDVLLLDEPTASMDAATEERVMTHLFEGLSPDNLTIVATHKANVLKHVSRIIVLEAGKVLMDGPRDQVLQTLREAPSRRGDS